MAFGSYSNDGISFGAVFTLDDRSQAAAAQINRTMQNLSMNTDDIANRINSALGKVQAGFALVLTGAALSAPIAFGVHIESEFERARLGLETLLKSKVEAQRVFDQTAKDAAETPFELKPLLMVNKALISAGISADNARQDTLALANAIAATGGGDDELGRMAVNMQQISNLGKATAADIKQFGFAGINIYKMLSEATGKNIDEIKEMDITYDMLSDALRQAAASGGMYEGALDKLSKSAFGKLSSISDNIKLTFAELGKVALEMLHPIFDFFLVALDAIRSFMQTTAGKIVAGIVVIGIALVSLTVIVIGLKVAFSALAVEVAALMLAFMPYLAPLLAIGAAFMLVKNAMNEFANMSVEAEKKVSGFTKFLQLLGGVAKGISEIWSSINFKDGTFSLNTDTFKKLQQLGIADFITNLGTWLVRIKALFTGVVDGLSRVFNIVKRVVLAAYDAIQKALKSFGIEIGKNAGDVQKLINVGRFLGVVLGVMLVAAVAASIVTLAVFALTLGVIILAMYGLYKIVDYCIQAYDWLSESTNGWAVVARIAIQTIMMPFTLLYELIVTIIDALSTMGSLLSTIGEEMPTEFSPALEGGAVERAGLRARPSVKDILAVEGMQKQGMAKATAKGEKPTNLKALNLNTVVQLDGKEIAKAVSKSNNIEMSRELDD